MKRKTLYRFLPWSAAALVAALNIAWPATARAQVRTWTGGGANGNWSDVLNWDGAVPVTNDLLLLGGGTNTLTNNNLAAGTVFSGLLFGPGSSNFSIGGNALTLSDTGAGVPVVENDAVNSVMNITAALTFTGGLSSAGMINAYDGDIYFGALNLSAATNLAINRSVGRTTIFGGAINAGTANVVLDDRGLSAFTAANTFSAGGILSVNGGRLQNLHAGGLGTAAAAANAAVMVGNGGQIAFNGVALTGNGKNFTIAGVGPDGRGALVNDYVGVDGQKVMNNLTLSGNATIGGTKTIDVGQGVAGQTLDGGGNTLAIATRNRFNIRTPNIVNLPQIIVNSGNVETEAVDVPAATSVTVNGNRSTLGAWLGGANTIRTWAGDVTLNNGANIGGIGTGGAASTLVIGSVGKTLTINGEGRLNANTQGFIDWVDIGGAGNMRVDSALSGSGKLVVGQWGVGTNGTTVTIAADSPGFSGPVQISAGTLALGTGGGTGTLGTAPSVDFVNGGGTPLLSIARVGNLTLNNSFSGPGNIQIDNTGAVVTLNGANTTGGAGVSAFATRVRGGTLILGAANALSPRATFEIGGLSAATGSLTKLNGFSPTVERLDDAATNTAGVFNRIVNDSATAATLTYNANNGGVVFGDFGGIVGGSTANENNLGLTKIGSADWNLAGSGHTYTGLTTVNGGTFRLATNGTYGIGKLGSSTGAADGTVVNPGGSFDFGGFSAGDERFIISGRGNTINANGFETGALRNNPGTAAASVNSAKFVSLAGNASIGKSGNGADANNWEIRNTGGAAQLNLSGNTLRKVGNNIVSVADVTGGTGDGNIDVRQGTLTLERGTSVDGAGTVTVLGGATLNLHDNGTAVTLTKSLTVNAGNLTNQSGSHALSGLSTNGYFTAQNNSAADTLGLGTVAGPARGSGAWIGTTGAVTMNGLALNQRPGPGWVAGPSVTTTAPAVWDGTKLVPIATTSNTGVPMSGMGVIDVLADSAADADRTISSDLTVRSLVSIADVKVNNGALLRIDDGSVTMRNNAHWIQTTAGTTMGRLTSGRADGELHLNLNATVIDSGIDGQVRLQVVDNPVTSGAMSGIFVPNLVVKNGGGGLNGYGSSNFAAPTTNTQNSYTAGTIINDGRVVPTFGSAFGTGPLTVRDGGQLATYNLTAANGAHISNALDLSGAGAFENAGYLGAIRLANAITLSGNTLLSSETRLHAHGAGDVGTLAGIVRGTAGIDKTGDGFLALNAPNTYTGPTTITRGTLVTNRLASGGTASGLGASSNAASNLVINGGVLRYDGPGATIDRGFTLDIASTAAGFAAGNAGITNNYHTGGLTLNPSSVVVTDGGDRALTLNATHRTTNVFNGVLSDPNAGRTSLQFGGIGTWQITQDQLLTGNVSVTNSATNFQGGTLIVGNGGTSGSIGNGLSLALANASDIAFNRSDNVTINHAIASAANSEVIQLGTGTLTLGGNADNVTNNVRIENGGTMVLAKNSNLNVHAVSANVFVNNGTLRIAGTGEDQIANGTAVFMRNTGTLDLNGRYEIVGRIEGLGGTVTNTAAGTSSEIRLGGPGNISSAFTGTFIPGVIGATGTGGFYGVIQDGAGTMKVSKDGTGLIALNGDNTYSGGTEILQGTLQVGRGGNTGSLGNGPVFLGAGDFGTNGSNVGTLRVNRTGTLTMNQVISGPGNVDKRGGGELVLTAQNTWEGITVVRNGTLTANLATNDNVLPVNAGYSLEGGTLRVLGRASGTSVQNFLPANVGQTNVSGAGAGAATATFNIQGGNLVGDNNGGDLIINLPPTLTRAAGGSIDFATAGAGTTTFRSIVANVASGLGSGIIGSATAAPATFNGTTWATQTGNGTLDGLAAGGYNTAAGHLDITGGPTVVVPAATTAATARLNAAGITTVDLSAGTTTLTQGGLLTTVAIGANNVTVQNGTLVSGGNEFFIHQHNTAGNLTISALLGGTNPVITKAGAGKLILTGANAGTGAVHINQGTLQVGAGGAGGTAGTLPGGAITNDGTFTVARTNGTFAAPYLLAAANIIGGSGSVRVEGGSGWVDFNKASHTYTGTTTVSSGYVQNLINGSGQVAPVILGDASTGSQPIALVSNHTAVQNFNFPIIVPADGGTGPVIIGSSGGTGAVAALYNGTLDLNRPTILAGFHPDRTTFTNSITGNVGTLTIDVLDGSGNPLLPGATPVASTIGARRVSWDAENSFVGNVEIRNGSTLQIGLGTAGVFRDQIPDASNVSLFGTNSTLQFNYEGEVINNLNGEAGSVVRSIAAGGAHMVLSVNGGIFNGQYDGSSGMYIEKNGNGTLVLGGPGDNNTGRVRVNSGTVELNKTVAGSKAVAADLTIDGGTVKITGTTGDQIWDGTVVTNNGGVLDLNGQSETISVLQGLGGTITNTAATTTSTLSIGNTSNAASSVFYGTINDGAGAVRVVKNSTVAHGLVLAGDNNYSGGTDLQAGVLQLGTGGTTGSAGTGPITTAANTRIVVDRSNAFTLANAISGGASLTHQGSGTVSLTGNNTHTGLNTINNGSILSIGDGGTTGTIGSGNISNFGELRFNRSNTLTISQSIADLVADTGVVRQAGTGKTILSGNSKYYGNTYVDAGTLQVDGKLWSGPLSVSAGATLGGTGIVTSSGVTISGSLAPGASPGVLDIDGSIAFSGASAAFSVELGGTTPSDGAGFYDQVNMVSSTGSISLGSSTDIVLTLDGGFSPSLGDTFYILTRVDGVAFGDFFDGLPEGQVFNSGGVGMQITYLANWTGTQAGSSLAGGNDVALVVVPLSIGPVPEPSTAMLSAGVALLALGRRRRVS